MKKILYYDCFAGISGDMNLAAMIDLGVPEDYLRSELEKLGLEGYKLIVTKDMRKGISGTRVDVELHEHHHHEGHHHSEHRNLGIISEIINQSSLSEKVKESSIKIFRLVAQAEAKVHGKNIDEIHFHEVGAVDSIVDIVGAAICMDYIKPDLVHVSTVELGGGFVECAHGTFPIPAPATVELLKGVPVKSGAVPFETTTPTGAAIIAAFADRYTDDKRFKIQNIAYGIGHRDTAIPNALRLFLGEADENPVVSDYCVLESNIDDMNPEIYGYLQEKLLKNGADDVYYTPIIMKKSRPAVMISILCRKEREMDISGLLFNETTTLGIRSSMISKHMLNRTERKVQTSLGEVRMKSAWLNGNIIKEKPEYEDCRSIAEKKDIPLREVYEIIAREVMKE